MRMLRDLRTSQTLMLFKASNRCSLKLGVFIIVAVVVAAVAAMGIRCAHMRLLYKIWP